MKMTMKFGFLAYASGPRTRRRARIEGKLFMATILSEHPSPAQVPSTLANKTSPDTLFSLLLVLMRPDLHNPLPPPAPPGAAFPL